MSDTTTRIAAGLAAVLIALSSLAAITQVPHGAPGTIAQAAPAILA